MTVVWKEQNQALFKSGNHEWETPQALFDKYNELYQFTVDVCATPENAKCKRFFTKEIDGLSQSWAGERCWMNPPYGRGIGKWIEKAYTENMLREATVVCLLPARTDTRWFHKYIYQHAEIYFLQGRLKFGSAKHNAPFPNMMVIYS